MFTKISVIIPNYNYALYVGAAIESALGLNWPNVEVIVIDDGSTDDSLDVIRRYSDRIKLISQKNSGQLIACNKGFAISSGDVVIFLDSDDLLDPDLPIQVASIWNAEVSKVQVQMRIIDREGRPTGAYFPQFLAVPTAAQIRNWSTQSAGYPTPPGSGNVYARTFLEKLFPLSDTAGSANDSYCIAAAPFLGDVVTIARPLASYRVHGKNQGALAKLDSKQFPRQLSRARLRRSYAREQAARVGIDLPDEALNRSFNYLCYRVASYRLAVADHPFRDSRLSIAKDFASAIFAPQGITWKSALALTAWGWAVSFLPQNYAKQLVTWRYVPGARPQGLLKFLKHVGMIRK